MASKQVYLEHTFYRLSNQGNLYSCLSLGGVSGHAKLLFSTLQGKIFCFEFVDGKLNVIEDILELNLSYESEIFSLNGVVTKCKTVDLAITVIQKKESSLENSILFYNNLNWLEYDNEKSRPTSSLSLDFTPYVLYYTLIHSVAKEKDDLPTVFRNAWLLSGSDLKLHLFHATYDSSQCLEEHSLNALFPEFNDINEIVINIDILYSKNFESRHSVVCCENGSVKLWFVSCQKREAGDFEPSVVWSRQFSFDFPVSNVKFFHKFANLDTELTTNGEKLPKSQNLHLIVTSTLESCFVYTVQEDIKKERGIELTNSESYDVVTSCAVCDVDFDGVNEIIIGTYGQVILIYKETAEGKWKISEKINVSSPVLHLTVVDFFGDGVKEILVHSVAGVHILQKSANIHQTENFPIISVNTYPPLKETIEVDPAHVASIIVDRLRAIKNN